MLLSHARTHKQNEKDERQYLFICHHNSLFLKRKDREKNIKKTKPLGKSINFELILQRIDCTCVENMLQYQCAKANGYDVIIINNGKYHIEFCNLPFMTAAEFLNKSGD